MKALVLLLGRVRAFVVRDFQLAVSYRLEFFMRILSILFVTTTLYFISRIFAGSFATPYEQWRDPFLAWITALPFLYLFFGWALFGVEYKGSFLLAVLILLLTTLVLASIGILSASFAMVFKRGDPLGMIIGTGSAL